MKRATFVIASFATLLAGTSAHAALLGLGLSLPDITSSFIDVTYNAGTDQFVASGFALNLNLPPDNNINNGTFNITATINDLGVAVAASLTINGTVLGNGPSLLTGVLAVNPAFGFQTGGGDIFEFLFTLTGGSLATPTYYGPIGTKIGVILDANFRPTGGFTGSWTTGFDNTGGASGNGNGVSDTGRVPAPATVTLLAVFGLMGTSRKRRS